MEYRGEGFEVHTLVHKLVGFFSLFLRLFICLFLAVLHLRCRMGFFQVQWEGFSLQWLLLWSTDSRVHGLQSLWHVGFSCSTAHGIFPDQGSNLCLLQWLMNSLPLSHHQGSPKQVVLNVNCFIALETYLQGVKYFLDQVAKCFSAWSQCC